MIRKLRSLLASSPVSIAFCGLICASAFAAAPRVRKVSAPSGLIPLQVSVGGRVLRTPVFDGKGFGSAEYVSQWPGTYLRTAFKGERAFFRVEKSEEILHVVVDDLPAVSLVKPEPGVYEVSGLSSGQHTLDVLVATEGQSGPNTFGGFAVPRGEKPLAPRLRSRQIEFVGDSHTVGYGDISGKRACTADEIWAGTDDTEAFGPMTARRFGADYQVNAISGRGVVRNYNGFKGDTLPEAYPFVLFDKAKRYEDPGWKPQVVVIALGTNDFSTPLNPGERWNTREELHADYEATYGRFLQGLRARDPQAYLIVWATGVAKGEVEEEARKVVAERKAQGDQHITFVPVNGLAFGGCDWHPSLADEKVISDKLVGLIEADEGVWRGR